MPMVCNITGDGENACHTLSIVFDTEKNPVNLKIFYFLHTPLNIPKVLHCITALGLYLSACLNSNLM